MLLRWWNERKWRHLPEHLRTGRRGEEAARRFLRRQGLQFVFANFKARRGEIDLIFRDQLSLVFVEVKTRSSEDWIRPAAAVDADKERILSEAALQYLRLLGQPLISFRFDIVEVLMRDGMVGEIRHLPNAFPLSEPLRYLP